MEFLPYLKGYRKMLRKINCLKNANHNKDQSILYTHYLRISGFTFGMAENSKSAIGKYENSGIKLKIFVAF